MAAAHEDTISNCVEHLACVHLNDSLKFLPREEFVLDETGVGYRVVVGSGVGSPISSDVCDLSFYQMEGLDH